MAASFQQGDNCVPCLNFRMTLSSAKSKPAPRSCECGCSEMTSGTRFRQGHDAKLKSALIRAALAGEDGAELRLFELGWSKFLEAKRAKLPVEVVEPPRRKRGRPRKVRPETEGPESCVLEEASQSSLPA